MKSKHALFVGWDRSIPGREQDAAELFSMSMSYWKKLKDQGAIDDYEVVMLEAHGGDLNGFVLLHGQGDKLHRLTTGDEWRDLVMRGEHLLSRFGVVQAVVDEGVNETMQNWTRMISRR